MKTGEGNIIIKKIKLEGWGRRNGLGRRTPVWHHYNLSHAGTVSI